MEKRFVGTAEMKLGRYVSGLLLTEVRDKNIWHSLSILISRK
jgi:hypothetical protein